MCPILGHLKIINFTFATNEKLMVLSVPVLKHITVDLFLDGLQHPGKQIGGHRSCLSL